MPCDRRTLSNRLWVMIEKFQSLIGANESGATSLQFRNGPLPIFGIQGFDRVLEPRTRRPRSSRPLAAKLTQNSVTTPKTTNSASGIEALQQFVSVQAFEDVERLLFEENLLVLRRSAGSFAGVVGDRDDVASQRFRNKSRSGRAFDAVRRKNRELGIIFDVKTAVRYQKTRTLRAASVSLWILGSKRSAPGT